jgi:hypothetical protein
LIFNGIIVFTIQVDLNSNPKSDSKKYYKNLIEPLLKVFKYDKEDKTHLKAHFMKIYELNDEGLKVEVPLDTLKILK